MTASPRWNASHEEDARYNLKWNRLIMRSLGIWSLVSDVSRFERVASVFLRILSVTCVCSTMSIIAIYIFGGGSDINGQLEMLGPFSYGLMSMLKYLCLVSRYKDIRRCVDTLKTDWRMVHDREDRDLMLKFTRRGHLLSKICFVFIYTGGVLYHTMMPFFINKNSRGGNGTNARPVPFHGFEDINVVADPTIACLFVGLLQASCGLSMFHITITVCSLAAVLVNHACGRFEIVMNRLRNMTDDEKRMIGYKERIGAIVELHVETLRFSSGIEKILRGVFLVEVVGSTLIICLLEYYCIVKFHNNDGGVVVITYATLLLSFVFNIFMYCCIGELLTDQHKSNVSAVQLMLARQSVYEVESHLCQGVACTNKYVFCAKCVKVGHACYDTAWYKVPARSALDFNPMIFMSQHPKRLTAGRMMPMSLISFTRVIKTSVAYLNLIRAMIQ